jgi:WD40 repeat protein
MSVACSPSEPLLASAGHEGSIHLWNIHTGERIRSFYSEKPYEGTNITGVTGITAAQRAALIALGAVENTAQDHHAEEN